jgi:hypothetical protein
MPSQQAWNQQIALQQLQQLTDPNYFLNDSVYGDFNTLSQDQSGYGALPAVEQNQTYFAYFNGIGGTTPEIINQTGFFIKYLIDSNGNVVKPNSNDINLLNLNTNFTPGSSVIISSQDATQIFSNLLDEQIITDIGTIQPILITGTGSNVNNFTRTMSFFQQDSIFLTENPPDFTFYVKKEDYGVITSNTTTYIGSVPGNIIYTSVINEGNPTYCDWNGNDGGYGTYTFNQDVTNGMSVFFRYQMILKSSGLTQAIGINMAIQLSTNGGTSWSNLPIEKVGGGLGSVNNNNNYLNAYYYTSMDGSDRLVGCRTIPSTFNTGDKIRFLFDKDGQDIAIITTTPTPNYVGAFSNYSGYTNVTSPYWAGATYPTTVFNFSSSQYITASLSMSGFLNGQWVQQTPASSSNFGYSRIVLPTEIQSGDYIRFEYDPSKQSRIYDITQDPLGRIVFKIFPAIPQGTNFSHFCIFRVVKDGNYIILNNEKNGEGTMTGFIIPKNISQTLRNDIPNIISKLEADGLLNQ